VLLDMVRDVLAARLGGYRRTLAARKEIDRFLVMPGLGPRAGLLGALAVARAMD